MERGKTVANRRAGRVNRACDVIPLWQVRLPWFQTCSSSLTTPKLVSGNNRRSTQLFEYGD